MDLLVRYCTCITQRLTAADGHTGRCLFMPPHPQQWPAFRTSHLRAMRCFCRCRVRRSMDPFYAASCMHASRHPCLTPESPPVTVDKSSGLVACSVLAFSSSGPGSNLFASPCIAVYIAHSASTTHPKQAAQHPATMNASHDHSPDSSHNHHHDPLTPQYPPDDSDPHHHDDHPDNGYPHGYGQLDDTARLLNDRPLRAGVQAEFERGPPAWWKRVLLILVIVAAGWYSVKLGQSAKPDVIYAQR